MSYQTEQDAVKESEALQAAHSGRSRGRSRCNKGSWLGIESSTTDTFEGQGVVVAGRAAQTQRCEESSEAGTMSGESEQSCEENARSRQQQVSKQRRPSLKAECSRKANEAYS